MTSIMKENIMQKLDNLDKQIINELLKTADISNEDLADIFHTSESTIRRRKRVLIENGIIRNAVVADPFSLGYTIMALIGIQVDPGATEVVEKALTKLPQIRFIGITIGRYDIFTEAWFKSNEEMLHFVTNELGQISGIYRSETLQVLKLAKYGYDWGQTAYDIEIDK